MRNKILTVFSISNLNLALMGPGNWSSSQHCSHLLSMEMQHHSPAALSQKCSFWETCTAGPHFQMPPHPFVPPSLTA